MGTEDRRSLLICSMEEPKTTPHGEHREASESGVEPAALLGLLGLLTREPPKDHDFKTCPICQYYEIEKL